MFLKDQGCLLRKSPSGEHYNLLVFFLRENGLQMTLARKTCKASAAVIDPDLFESGEVDIEKKGQNKPAFLKEFLPQSRYPGIARRYQALETASRLTRFYEKNLIHMEYYDAAWELLHTALDAFCHKQQSSVVLLKSMFVFAGQEGYPVKDAWLEKLPVRTKSAVRQVIQSPVDSLQVDNSRLAAWIHDLEQYFLQHTEILIPD